MSTNGPFERVQNRLSSDHLSILPPPPPHWCSHKVQRLALSDPVSRTGSVCRWLLLPGHKLTEAFCSVACLLHSLVFHHLSSFSVTSVPVLCHPLSSMSTHCHPMDRLSWLFSGLLLSSQLGWNPHRAREVCLLFVCHWLHPQPDTTMFGT